MPITELLERNAKEFGSETALVEINPEVREVRRVTWKEYDLIESAPTQAYRREITWSVFEEKANRCANLLLSRGIKKGDKVAILLMNGVTPLINKATRPRLFGKRPRTRRKPAA